MLTSLMATNWILLIALAWVLISKYRRTRDAGFLWLAVALIAWPIASVLLMQLEKIMIDRVSSGESSRFYPFSLIAAGRLSIGELVAGFALFHKAISFVLIIIGVTRLYKKKSPYPTNGAAQDKLPDDTARDYNG